MDARTAAALGVAVAAVTAGCVGPVPGSILSSEGTGEPAHSPDWTPGNWWSFRVEVPGDGHAEGTFVVHEAGSDGYRLGSDGTSGFFGIPFHGRLAPDLDPQVAGERWDMFRFPLRDGARWIQQFLGHPVTTTVHAATLDLPDGETTPGYRLEASAYGSPVATYTYAPETAWITSFNLRDPETGEHLAWANLTGYGEEYGEGYLVREKAHDIERSYPGETPGEESFRVASDGIRLVATLTAEAGPGMAEARLEDPDGETVAQVEAKGRSVEDAQTAWPVEPGDWTLRHRGVGSGEVSLQVHVVRQAGPGGASPNDPAGGRDGGPLGPSLAAVLEGAAG